jgi:hypothetical protein
MKESSAKNGFFSGDSMGWIKNTDALALVVRNFNDDLTGDPTPLRDIDEIDTELLLADLIIVENRLERLEWSRKQGQKSNSHALEERTLRKIAEQLNNNHPIRNLEFDEDEEKMIRGFQFFTKKRFLLF